MPRTVTATRYVTPLREGGSLPAIVEADDAGLYVLKFRAAGQGVRALVAELLAGELARALGLRVPEIVFVELDPRLGRNEPDDEVRELLQQSAGLNLALDYLPGSVTFDPVVGPAPDARIASEIVLFDAFVTNIDRTPKNPNLLVWHRDLWCIDHGASLYFHHTWTDPQGAAKSPFKAVKDHVLLPFATQLAAAGGALAAKVSDELVDRLVREIPDGWLGTEFGFSSPDEHRAAYATWLRERRSTVPVFLEEAERARAQLV